MEEWFLRSFRAWRWAWASLDPCSAHVWTWLSPWVIQLLIVLFGNCATELKPHWPGEVSKGNRQPSGNSQIVVLFGVVFFPLLTCTSLPGVSFPQSIAVNIVYSPWISWGKIGKHSQEVEVNGRDLRPCLASGCTTTFPLALLLPRRQSHEALSCKSGKGMK